MVIAHASIGEQLSEPSQCCILNNTVQSTSSIILLSVMIRQISSHSMTKGELAQPLLPG